MEHGLYDEFAEVGEKHWWFVARRDVIRSVLRASMPSRPPAGHKVLDVGCGTGEMLEMLSAFGAVNGLDISPRAVEYCNDRKLPDTQVVVGRIPEDIPTAGEFGLVTAFDVIEHLDDAVGGLRTMRAALEPGGVLVVTVPAYKFLWSAHDDQNHHKRRYTRRLLRRHLEDAGFVIKRMSHFNTLLFPPVVAVRLWHKVRPAKDEQTSDLKMPGDRVNAILRRVYGFEAAVVRRASLPFGVSIIAVATRPA